MHIISKSKCLVALNLFFLTGCYYDNMSTLYPGSYTCETVANPGFALHVLPLLNSKCNTCHGGSSPSAGIKLDSYTEVGKYITSGSLMGSMNHASGFSAMPKNGSKMPACEIQIIQDWINAGALNN
jgi:cytochrome c5